MEKRSAADLNKDLELWRDYRQNPGKETFNALYNQMRPVIQSAIGPIKRSSQLPKAVFDIEAANQFLKTINTYDPTKGASLATKTQADMKKVNRIQYQYQNIGRIPENRILHIGALQSAASTLRDELGRDPSDAELADEMSMPLKSVSLLRREMRPDLVDEPGLENRFMDFEDPNEQKKAQYVYYDLNGTEQLVFDLATGSHGKPALLTPTGKPDWAAIAKRARLNPDQIRRIRGKIRKKWATL